MVRAGANCLTIAFCHDIHEDATLTVQDLDVAYLNHIIEIFRTVRNDLNIPMPKDGKTVRLTGAQIRAKGGVERLCPWPVGDGHGR